MYIKVLNEIIIFFQFHLEKQSLKYNLNKWHKMAQEKKGRYLFNIFLDANFCAHYWAPVTMIRANSRVLYRSFGTCW